MSISGCSYISFKKYKTPDVAYPDINNSSCSDVNCTVIKTLTNYEKMKRYAAELRSANETCK